jgi:hypothetical protein
MMAGGYQTTSFYHDKPGSLSLPSCISYILRTKQKEVLKGSEKDTDIAENKRCFVVMEMQWVQFVDTERAQTSAAASTSLSLLVTSHTRLSASSTLFPS